jgi:hypothetical protein
VNLLSINVLFIPQLIIEVINLFMVIHLNVWGPNPTVSLSGIRCFVTFIDFYSHNTWIYLMHNKNEVFSTLRDFIT